MPESQMDKDTAGPLRILAVDDEGYQVEVATNGRATLERARQEKFDLVILDVMLPGVDNIHSSLQTQYLDMEMRL